MRLGLVYLPPSDVSERFVRFAERIVEGKRARVVLGPTCLAHLSLLHVETDAAPEDIWREVESALLENAPPKTCPIDVLGLGLLRYDKPYNAPPAPPGTMAWLLAPCSPALRSAMESALALPFARRSRVTTENGDRFQPHFTIAIWDGETNLPTDVVLAQEIFDRPSFEGRLALGIVGANGVFVRSLFEAG